MPVASLPLENRVRPGLRCKLARELNPNPLGSSWFDDKAPAPSIPAAQPERSRLVERATALKIDRMNPVPGFDDRGTFGCLRQIVNREFPYCIPARTSARRASMERRPVSVLKRQ